MTVITDIICNENNIQFNIVDYSGKFNSREQVMIWIISTQISRRNLSPEQMYYYRARQYEMEKVIEPRNQYTTKPAPDNNYQQQTTREKIAEQYNVSPATIQHDVKVANVIDTIGETSPEAKQKILSGKSNISKKELEKLTTKPKEEIEKEIKKP